jgi:beta-lactamase class D
MFSPIACLLLIFAFTTCAQAETKCLLIKENDRVLKSEGDCTIRHSPCSTFKIALSLMGFDQGFLKDEKTPKLLYKEGYVKFLPIWKEPHDPQRWMKNSCVWYSQVLTPQIGMEKFKEYLAKFSYGNQDASGDPGKNNGLTDCWLSSSLKVSAEEQVTFLEKLLSNQLPVSKKARQMTRKILFIERLPNGWDLYGKIGAGLYASAGGSQKKDRQMGWYVGWIQKGDRQIIFVSYVEDIYKGDLDVRQRAQEKARAEIARF